MYWMILRRIVVLVVLHRIDMKIDYETWTIKKLIEQKDNIDPKPQYQRTSVWSPRKKQLLIDSILRGYDLPKFYLMRTSLNPLFTFEVTDGQQRMRSIWEFASTNNGESFQLLEATVDGINTKNLKYSDFKKDDYIELKRRFLSYEIHMSIIEDISQEEIRALFARLQMGEKLNQVELRHAMASNLGAALFSITETHPFFKESKISNTRYKHQDYLDHAFSLLYFSASRNLKASDLRIMYQELSSAQLNNLQPMLSDLKATLDFMREINSKKKGLFKNKWAFVDMFLLISRNLDRIKTVKPSELVKSFESFEYKRKANNRVPERLIEDKTSLIYDKDIYDYIVAFKTGGAERNNYLIRHRVFTNKFLNSDNFIFKP